MIDPSRLMASATRLYGADMERLWGEMRPVAGGTCAGAALAASASTAGGRTLDVAYTPGHASPPCQLLRSAAAASPSSATWPGSGAERATMFYPRHRRRTSTSRPGGRARTDPGLESRHAVPDPFRRLSRRTAAFSGAVRAAPGVERSGPPAPARSATDRRDRVRNGSWMKRSRNCAGPSARPKQARYSRAGRLDYSWQGLSRYWVKRTQSERKAGPT